jgi:hypothetical protein
MNGRGVFMACVLLLAGAGCARRAERAALPNLIVPVSCASEITLIGCDAKASPPKCKSARVKYRRGCEEIAVK